MIEGYKNGAIPSRIDKMEQEIESYQATFHFLAGQCHEFHTLISCLNYVHLLLETPLTPEQHHHVEIIRQSKDALIRHVNDFFDFIKIAAGDYERVIERVKIYECVDRLLEQTQGGEGKCPPEDCGGISGYFEFLEAVLNPLHPEHHRMVEWCGCQYDPNDFDYQKVTFDNPKKRWRRAFQHS